MDIGMAAREFLGIFREIAREIAVLEIADPVGPAEVQQVYDRVKVQTAHLGEDVVCPTPIVWAGTDVSLVESRAPAQVFEPQFASQRKILLPTPIMPALFHLVDPFASSNCGIAVFDAGGEHEPGHRSIPLGS